MTLTYRENATRGVEVTLTMPDEGFTPPSVIILAAEYPTPAAICLPLREAVSDGR